MKKRLPTVPAEQVLDDLSKCIQDYIKTVMRVDMSLMEFADTYPYFCITHTNSFHFSTNAAFVNNPIPYESLFPYKTINDNTGNSLYWNITQATLKRVIPFLLFKKKNEFWVTDWYSTKDFFNLFPTRIKIIDELLKTL